MLKKKPRVFISYVREDLKQVKRLVKDLEKAGIEVWWDQLLSPGEHWKEVIREKIKKNDFFIACFSESYSQKSKTYMNEEINVAINEMRKLPPRAVWFLPIRFSENCQVPEFKINQLESLQDLQITDLSGSKYEAGLKKLVETINPPPPLPESIDAALAQLEDPNPTVRVHAAGILSAVHELSMKESEHSKQFIIKALKKALSKEDPSTKVWDELVKVLDNLMPYDEEALQFFRNLPDTDRGIPSLNTALALCKRGDESAVAAIPIHLSRYSCSSELLEKELSPALFSLGKPAVDTLTAALDSDDANIRMAAVYMLGTLGDTQTLEFVYTSDFSEKLPDWAVKTIDLHDYLIEKAAEPLCKALKDEHESVRQTAAISLGLIEYGLDPLLEALQDEIASVRASAAFALSRINPFTKADIVFARLVEALKDKSVEVRRQAAFALISFGSKGFEAVKAAGLERYLP